MLYSLTETIASGGTVDTPERHVLTVTRGIITRVVIRWRWGSADLCGSRILYHETPVWPLSRNSWVPSFPEPIDLAEFYVLDSEPYELAVEAYNTDAEWDHAIWVAVVVDDRPDLPTLLLDLAEYVAEVGYD